ncbi:uncharacterized protein MYCGRDRAFT_97775 [Zymoseptoria tritici IPO323]|uniref:Uncharacterized protein n=1 Tax=Zymoseptoria tritici (strain CBS 115943 / IPO323) TaxID=336722 RepID=F9XRC1_ZYMTI|nr:uncharacterized protein MYCGRDRAFT_97775 [Zymoseptoria tritici IPO323]EGP82228.1 hypothetical protein MYCGRDRAFT_97775 [Zymoseptoria tritici IPO323]
MADTSMQRPTKASSKNRPNAPHERLRRIHHQIATSTHAKEHSITKRHKRTRWTLGESANIHGHLLHLGCLAIEDFRTTEAEPGRHAAQVREMSSSNSEPQTSSAQRPDIHISCLLINGHQNNQANAQQIPAITKAGRTRSTRPENFTCPRIRSGFLANGNQDKYSTPRPFFFEAGDGLAGELGPARSV